MPRPPRYELVGIPQHVVQRGNNRQTTFFTERDYRVYLDFLREAVRRQDCSVHAYVLMTNHVHLLMTPNRPMAIARVMQSLGRRYVRYANDYYERTGTMWEGRYKASLVATGSYLLNCYRYIELNPVRAGLVVNPARYPWSSHGHNAYGATNRLVEKHPEYLALGEGPTERVVAYRGLFTPELDRQTLAEIRRDLNECRAFGDEQFKTDIEAKLGRRVRRNKPGRPRKRPDTSSVDQNNGSDTTSDQETAV